MDSFDFKKYLAEGRLFKENTQAPLREIKVKAPFPTTPPEGWEEIENPLEYFDGYDDEDDPGKVLIAWKAPMEGWDYDHEDLVMIKKEYTYNPETGEFEGEGKFYIYGYVAFGNFENQGPYDTYEEALEKAFEVMEEFKDDWI